VVLGTAPKKCIAAPDPAKYCKVHLGAAAHRFEVKVQVYSEVLARAQLPFIGSPSSFETTPVEDTVPETVMGLVTPGVVFTSLNDPTMVLVATKSAPVFWHVIRKTPVVFVGTVVVKFLTETEVGDDAFRIAE
jgi:hypothetical protein